MSTRPIINNDRTGRRIPCRSPIPIRAWPSSDVGDLRNYAEHGYGLWIIRTRREGSFVGDCGLTWQEVDSKPVLEIGYHVAPAHQGSGYPTEAAKACLDLALGPLNAGHVTTIINPENAPLRRVAKKLGMTLEFETTDGQARPIVCTDACRDRRHCALRPERLTVGLRRVDRTWPQIAQSGM